jgi:APA family basic amino acid/polyamine antiporter
MGESPEGRDGELVRGLGSWDAALVTVGSVLGTGIFLTTGDIARALPHAGLVLLVWIVGGLLTLAGALTYGELGGLFPEAGGQYVYLREAYGRFWGFLFGWAAFFVIMSGGNAAIAVGFGEYLGAFVPAFSSAHVLASAAIGPWTWQLTGAQVSGALAIALLTAVNIGGLREGALVQNLVTVVKVAAIVALATAGLVLPTRVASDYAAPLPSGLVAGLGAAMVAVLWSFDGWYAVTNLGGELARPGRDLPRGLALGTAAVAALYVLANVFYVHALPLDDLGRTTRVGEAAAGAVFGPAGGRLAAAAVVLSAFGCLAANVLYTARIYVPMARDGVFFRALGRIAPRRCVPAASLLVHGGWAVVLALSGSFTQLYSYVIALVVFFHAATGAAVFVLRRTLPDRPRPYRAWGYPLVPALFVLASATLAAATLWSAPVESLLGLGVLALGLPAYAWWSRRPGVVAGGPL